MTSKTIQNTFGEFEQKFQKSFLDSGKLDTAGYLKPYEAAPIIHLIGKKSDFFTQINYMNLTKPDMFLNTLEFQDNMIRPAAQQVSPDRVFFIADADMAEPTMASPKLVTHRLGSRVWFPYDVIHRLIQSTEEDFTKAILAYATEKFAKDLEEHLLCASTNVTTPIAYASYPLTIFDGFVKLIDSGGTVIDFGGTDPIVTNNSGTLDDSKLQQGIAAIYDQLGDRSEWMLILPSIGELSEKSIQKELTDQYVDKKEIENKPSTIHGIQFYALDKMLTYTNEYETVANDPRGTLYSAILAHKRNMVVGVYDGDMSIDLVKNHYYDGYDLFIKANVGCQLVDASRTVHYKSILKP